MHELEIPERLKSEFLTVELILATSAETRTVDALVLSWVKYEKQLRRLFSFFVFQHPEITKDTLHSVVAAFSECRNLNPETFIAGIEALGITPLRDLVGESYDRLWSEITRIRSYRNKIMHGQLTGQTRSSCHLERDIIHIVNWISTIAQVANDAFGYDGLQRDTYAAAKASDIRYVEKYPFPTLSELRGWFLQLS